MPERQRMTTRLKTLFQRPALFVLAGGINPIGAKMAEALGYDADRFLSGRLRISHAGTDARERPDTRPSSRLIQFFRHFV
jgi:2-methylisocitrate lyase-like PEP mutase family enzyme